MFGPRKIWQPWSAPDLDLVSGNGSSVVKVVGVPADPDFSAVEEGGQGRRHHSRFWNQDRVRQFSVTSWQKVGFETVLVQKF
jgi:hypothetical protein